MAQLRSLATGFFCAILSLATHAQTLTITAIPDQDEALLRARFAKIAAYLERTLHVDVRFLPAKTYAEAVAAFSDNQVQLGWFGGLSGAQARRQVPGSEAIVQGFEDQFFRTYLIANTSTGLMPSRELTDGIRDLTFTFGSRDSASGRLMPEFYLRQTFNQSPGELFRRVGFSGDHSRTIALVESGAYQLGVVNFKVWQRDVANGKVDTSKVRVIWESPTYPNYQWTIRGDVDDRFGEGFKAQVTKVLLELSDPELLSTFPRQKFVPASNADYRPIEQVARQLGLLD